MDDISSMNLNPQTGQDGWASIVSFSRICSWLQSGLEQRVTESWIDWQLGFAPGFIRKVALVHEPRPSRDSALATSTCGKMGSFSSKAKGNPQVKKIVDKVWDRFASTSEGQEVLGVQDLYCAVLLIYNDINKTLPGPFNDPPSKEEVEELLRVSDKNGDGVLDRAEFTAFIETFTKRVSARVGTNILVFSLVIPAVVSLSRPRAELLPSPVGPLVKKAPAPIYSAVVTAVIVFLGSQIQSLRKQ